MLHLQCQCLRCRRYRLDWQQLCRPGQLGSCLQSSGGYVQCRSVQWRRWLYVHYSGHGGSQRDTDPNTDEVDGMDETLIPVDYEKAGVIVDDDIHAMLVAGLPQGVRLTAIM